MGIYRKILAYILIIYAGGNRFSHLLYLGCEGIMDKLFAVAKLPLASTTLTRLLGKIRKLGLRKIQSYVIRIQPIV
jgi:hypothetical protein